MANVDASLDGDTKEIARKYPRSEKGLREFFQYVVREVKYKADGPEQETIKYPARTLRDGKGDCKSMSILIASFLKDKGIPYIYRYTYTDKNNPLGWHVYPIAELGGKKYTMDAVVKQFNKEHPYIAKFDYSPKDIVAVSGIQGVQSRQTGVPKRNYIDPYNWTQGEITAALLYDQTNILSWADPENASLEKDKILIQDALFLGVNTTEGLEKIRKIENAQLRAAMSRANRENQSVNGNRAGVAGPIIPAEDCSRYTTPAYQQYNPNYYEEYERCVNQNRWKAMLNDHLEDSAHHLLYEYEDRPNDAPATVAAKKVLHVGAVDALSSITEISRYNMRLWLRNGVLRKNAEAGAGALQPESTIPALAQAAQEGIGLPIPVIVAIIGAIATAVAGTLQLISVMKATEAQQLRAAAQTIGQQNFGPLSSDWMTAQQFEQSQSGQPGLFSQENIIPLAAAAAGAIIISRNI